MNKRILSTTAIIAASLSMPLAAGTFYLGPAVTYEDLRGSDSTYTSVFPSLYLGYGAWTRDWLYLALEGLVTTKSINTKDTDETNSFLKMDYNYGLSLVPMVNLDDVLFGFARIGYLRTKFPNLDSTHGAYQFGLGLQATLVECWDLRAEADYLKYRSIDGVGSLHALTYTGALIYKFDFV